MNYIEAYKAVIKGYKVKRLEWERFRESENYYYKNTQEMITNITHPDVIAEDWYIIPERFGWDRAVQLLKDGKKIRSDKFVPGHFISHQRNTDEILLSCGDRQNSWIPELKDFTEKYWLEIKE